MSGIYIPGMEMPKQEIDYIELKIYGDGTVLCRQGLAGIFRNATTAIPVTDHGRLIEADKCEQYFYEHLDDLHMIAAQNAIDDMPTIIPASKDGET